MSLLLTETTPTGAKGWLLSLESPGPLGALEG